jgi:beta-lactamase superfamily II metal-dependent hydrolase
MLKIHFLNVGNGDTTIIELPDDKLMLIDINRSNEFDEDSAKEIAESLGMDFGQIYASKKQGKSYYQQIVAEYDIVLDDPIVYLEDLGKNSVYRYIQTHPDLDHLSGFKDLIKYPISNFWDTDHTIEKNEFQSDSDKEAWKAYIKYRKTNTPLFLYRSTTPITPKEGSYNYEIYVFHPTKVAVRSGNEQNKPNFMSYLILLKYGNYKAVFGGDVIEDHWKEIWELTKNDKKAQDLFSGAHTFKASHHGRDSGRCGKEMLNLMDPEYVIISVGKKDEKNDATEWYRKRPDESSRNVWTTRWRGTIWVETNGESKPIVASRYDRKDTRDHIETIPFLSETPYYVKLKAKIGKEVYEALDKKFRWVSKSHRKKFLKYFDKYKSGGKALDKNLFIKFSIEDHNIPDNFITKWRVVNTGEEARKANDLRGKIEEDNEGIHERRECTKYRGTHYIECFAIKDEKCIAKSERFYVNIK